MTDKVEIKDVKDVEVKKAPARKPVAKKAKAVKPAVKKAPVKKPVARKAKAEKPVEQVAVEKTKEVVDKLEHSVIAVPFKVANKTFLASVGLLMLVQKELDKKVNEFDRKFSKYAKDGEKVVGKWEHKVEGFRKDVEKKVDEARDRVRDTFKKAA
jgi:hypothetical protein